MDMTDQKSRTAALTLAALGVVYGDIGTSPLYTVKEIFAPATGIALNPANIIGAISAIFWALMVVVTLKYVLLILRADNRGEGGGLALTALAANAVRAQPVLRGTLLVLGVFGATLFYGDSVITPAISVLGALEGLEVLTPDFKPYVVPMAIGVLFFLFFAQRKGTQAVGKFFGPVIALWFVVLAVTGVVQIAQQPAVLQALNPWMALSFLIDRGPLVLAAVGAIVLALTGAEALYADMGHFGRRPIQYAWMGLVLPGLALHYLGQGALLMQDPGALENPFFKMFPEVMLWPAVILATLAAIIASQAVISGAYSMTKQAILLGYLPRMQIKHTSELDLGQIYIPLVNWALLAGVVLAVLGFQSSSALAGAYGIAVTLTMMITTIMTFFVIRKGWHFSLGVSLLATAFFLCLDGFLFAGCIIKLFEGGWFPLLMGLLLFVIMTTWSEGRALLVASIHHDGLELQPFIDSIDFKTSHVSERTAIYAVSNSEIVPQALLHNMKHNQVVHRKNVIMTVQFEEIPWVDVNDQLHIEQLNEHFWRVVIKLGFMNDTHIPKILEKANELGLEIVPFESSYFLSRETVVSTPGGGMMQWREKLFAAMSRNSGDIAEFFKLPDNSVVELGTRVQS
jgi:KUP system potassium uptake protein